MTQIPTKAEDEVLREAVTDGFLVNDFLLPSLLSESPKIKTTVQQLSPDSEPESATGEAPTSVFFQNTGDPYATTTQNVSHAQSSSTVSSKDSDDTSSDSSTTQNPQSGFTSSSEPKEAQSSVTPDHVSVSQTSDPAVSSFDLLSTLSSDLESENVEVLGQYPATSFSVTSSSNTESSTSSLTFTPSRISHKAPRLFEESDASQLTSTEGKTEELSVSTTTEKAKQVVQVSINPMP